MWATVRGDELHRVIGLGQLQVPRVGTVRSVSSTPFLWRHTRKTSASTGPTTSSHPRTAPPDQGQSLRGHMPGMAWAWWTSISQPPGMVRWGWAWVSSRAAAKSSASMML